MHARLVALALASSLLAPALAQDNPLDRGGGPDNPLARKAPWAGTFTDGEVTLVLDQEGDGFSGTLQVFGNSYPVSGQAPDESTTAPPALSGTFRAGRAEFPFTALLEGQTLILESEGNTYRLERQQPPRPQNPLAGGVGQPKPADRDPGQPAGARLQDVYEGPTQPFQLPAGWLQFEVPEGWRVQQQDEVLVFDLGYQAGQVREALVLAQYGDLTPEERQLQPGELLRQGAPLLQQELTSLGITVTNPDAEPRAVQLEGGPGVVLEWTGTQPNGIQVAVWVGGLVDEGYFFLVTGIVQQGKEPTYYPRIRRLLASARITAPAPGSTAPLVGKEFFSESIEGGGAFYVTYEFLDATNVRKTMMMSGGLPGGDVGGSTKEMGTYQVKGDQVFLTFEGEQVSLRMVRVDDRVTALRASSGRTYSARN